MGRPASMFYWRSRGCFATDAGGTRTVLVKGPKTNTNHRLALERLAAFLKDEWPPKPPEQDEAAASTEADGPTLGEAVDSFLEDCELRVQAGDMKPNTVESYYRPYLRLIKRSLGEAPLSDLSRRDILAYRSELTGRQLSSDTVRNHLSVLRTCLAWARDAGFPVPEGIHKIPRPPRGRRTNIPSQADIDKLLQAATPDVGDVLETLLNVAVRPGDLFALRRDEVDLEAEVLRLTDTKTGPRIVCLPPRAAEIIRRRLREGSPGGYVFTTITGRPWNFRYFGEKLRKIRQRAGLGDHVVAYACRHRWTTGAFLQGLDLATVRALRGDRDIRTTLGYEHLSQHHGHLKQAARRAVGADSEDGRQSPERPPDENG